MEDGEWRMERFKVYEFGVRTSPINSKLINS
jgi:hypothetical protein